MLRLGEEYALGDMLKHATATNRLALAFQEPTEAALVRAKQAIDALAAQGTRAFRPSYLTNMARLFWMAGRCTEGLAVIEEAAGLIEHHGERLSEAELWRVKGELLLKASGNAHAEAETCYHKALEIARRQRAKAWELRAATSLARLWQRQGRHQDARQMLTDCYGWFSEGFDSADLKEARALLDALSAETRA